MSTRESPGASVASGGCQCGAVRYELTGAPLAVFVCHCRECRKQSASAFGISVIVRVEDLAILRGETRVWTRATDSGGRLDCHFCPVCGSRLWHIRGGIPERVFIKGGSLDEPPALSSAVHIWTKRKLPGVLIPPGAECHAGEPPE